MNTPVITVSFDIDTGVYMLMATSYSHTEPAGPRLFRAPPHPDVRFNHDSQEAADRDAATLQKYLDSLPEPKGRKKPSSRSAFSD